MYFITTKRMLEVCFSAHPNIQYRTFIKYILQSITYFWNLFPFLRKYDIFILNNARMDKY